MRTSVLTMAMFGLLGFLLSAAAVLAATLLDRSIRTASDVAERLHVVALASLPKAPHMPSFEPTPDSIPQRRGGTTMTTLNELSVPEDNPRPAVRGSPLTPRRARDR